MTGVRIFNQEGNRKKIFSPHSGKNITGGPGLMSAGTERGD